MNKYTFKISSTKFILLFVFFVYVSNNILIIDKILKWFINKNELDIFGIVAFYIAGLFLAISLFTILSHKYIIKIFAILVVILSALSTYFISKYNIAIDRSMVLNVWYTDTVESLALLSYSMLPYFLFLVLIPILIILKSDIIFEKKLKHIFKNIFLFIVSILISLSFIYLQFNSMHKAGNKSQKYIIYQLVPINFIISIGSAVKHYIKDNYNFEKKHIKIEGKVLSNDDLIVVLAIGETSRQKNFELYGYNKNTNPLLKQKKNLYALNGIAKYGSTIYAIPNILSRNDIKLPSITSDLGIKTSCFSNFKLYGNCGIAKETMVSNCSHNGKCFDEDVIPLFKEDLKTYENGKKMIVLHLGGGSHGPLYNKRIPSEFKTFLPVCEDADVINNCTKNELFNSFDNTILYVDYVVSNIINELEQKDLPYVFIYISDHGESLLENGRIFHGMPPGIDLPDEQAQIPLLVQSSIPISIVKKDKYKQQELYDTILDLFDIKINILRKEKVFILKNKI